MAELAPKSLAFVAVVAYGRMMDTQGTRGKRIPINERIAIGLWLGAAGLYLIVEAFVASAFAPPYRYTYNYISDLGVPDCGIIYAGRTICSPLHALMNLDFAIPGCLFFAAALAVSFSLTRRVKYVFLACAALNALGNILISLYPETASAGIGAFPYHVLGALLALVFGNATALASAWAFEGLGLPSLHRRGAIVLPVLAAIAFTMLIVARTPGLPSVLPDAVWERLSAYPITAWEFLSALCLLAARRARTGPVSAHS